MRVGVALPVEVRGVTGQTLIDWMIRAEEGAFETIAVTDEIVSRTYDSLTTLAAAAAVTRRVRLMSAVIAGPTRNTALLAKQAASIDALSGGRLSLGLGVGDLVDDFAAVGVPLRGRGKRFDEQLAQLKRLWSGEPVGRSGRSIGPPPPGPRGQSCCSAAGRRRRWTASGGWSRSASMRSFSILSSPRSTSWTDSSRSLVDSARPNQALGHHRLGQIALAITLILTVEIARWINRWNTCRTYPRAL